MKKYIFNVKNNGIIIQDREGNEIGIIEKQSGFFEKRIYVLRFFGKNENIQPTILSDDWKLSDVAEIIEKRIKELEGDY